MKTLDESYRSMMKAKRDRYMYRIDDVSAILNIRKEHVVDAQLGKPVPIEVANAIMSWLEVNA